MKCEICSQKVQKTFLDKVIGTQVKDEKGKKHMICFECQKKFQTKQDVLDRLGKAF